MTGPGMMFDWDGMTANWGSTATTTCCTRPPAVSQSAIVLPGTSSGQGDGPGGRHRSVARWASCWLASRPALYGASR